MNAIVIHMSVLVRWLMVSIVSSFQDHPSSSSLDQEIETVLTDDELNASWRTLRPEVD